MNNNASFYSSANSSTSTLRPRNNRLISYQDESQDESVAETTSTSARPNSRSTSPSAANGITRTRSKGKPQPAQQLRQSAAYNRSNSDYATADRRASGGLWESWSNLQGIASTLLGSDTSNGPVRRTKSVRNASRMPYEKSTASKQPQQEWGPKSQAEPAPTSIEEHQALLQAKKREALLMSSVQAQSQKDTLGRHKRKDSNVDVHPYTGASDADVLVYRHKVQPQDTMAGVVIKYSCQPEAFRKANRFWPNDNIQRRKFVVLPVDACAVKGRKTEGPYMAGLGDRPAYSNSSASAENASTETLPTEPFPPAEIPKKEDSDYRHDCWVLLPSFPQPIEILRISKRILGYFPQARRKSITSLSTPFSDSSSTSTPKTSFDMLRHPPTHAAQQAQLQLHLSSLSPNSSPVRQPMLPRHLTSPSRSRSSSTVSNPNGPSQANANTFLYTLQGPGGVGTLRGLRTERARPGPAEDPLNQKFAQYFPELLPADHEHALAANALSLRPPHSRTESTSLRGIASPRESMDSIRSTRSNSSSTLLPGKGKVEGWIRRVAKSSNGNGIGNAAGGSGVTSPLRKRGDLSRSERNELMLGEAAIGGDVGDLIELSTTPDDVSRQLHEAVEEDLTPVATPRVGIGLEGDAGCGELLDERFPVRGRVRRAYVAD